MLTVYASTLNGERYKKFGPNGATQKKPKFLLNACSMAFLLNLSTSGRLRQMCNVNEKLHIVSMPKQIGELTAAKPQRIYKLCLLCAYGLGRFFGWARTEDAAIKF